MASNTVCTVDGCPKCFDEQLQLLFEALQSYADSVLLSVLPKVDFMRINCYEYDKTEPLPVKSEALHQAIQTNEHLQRRPRTQYSYLCPRLTSSRWAAHFDLVMRKLREEAQLYPCTLE